MRKKPGPLAKNIRRAREAAGLTPHEFAVRIGAPRSSVCEWERGDHLPRLDRLRKIAKVCGWSLGELLGAS